MHIEVLGRGRETRNGSQPNEESLTSLVCTWIHAECTIMQHFLSRYTSASYPYSVCVVCLRTKEESTHVN